MREEGLDLGREDEGLSGPPEIERLNAVAVAHEVKPLLAASHIAKAAMPSIRRANSRTPQST